MTAEEYYQEGNAWRKQGDFKRALDSYMEAIALNPESPAVAAKEMLDDIMSFIAKTTTIHSNLLWTAAVLATPVKNDNIRKRKYIEYEQN